MWTAKTLIRLGGCPGYPSLCWAHMPLSWFCHEAALIANSMIFLNFSNTMICCACYFFSHCSVDFFPEPLESCHNLFKTESRVS